MSSFGDRRARRQSKNGEETFKGVKDRQIITSRRVEALVDLPAALPSISIYEGSLPLP